jgi:hypothetical protein
MSRNLFWLSDEQWEWFELHLPTDVRGKKRVVAGLSVVSCICSRVVPLVRLFRSPWSVDNDL